MIERDLADVECYACQICPRNARYCPYVPKGVDPPKLCPERLPRKARRERALARAEWAKLTEQKPQDIQIRSPQPATAAIRMQQGGGAVWVSGAATYNMDTVIRDLVGPPDEEKPS